MTRPRSFPRRDDRLTSKRRAYGPCVQALEDRAVPTGTLSLTGIATLPFTATGNGFRVVGGPTADAAGNIYLPLINFDVSSDDIGEIIEVPAGTTSYKVIASFSNAEMQGAPNSQLAIDADGNLFGTTSTGGLASLGTVFEVPHGGGGVTTLAQFTADTGQTPVGVTYSGGVLYGTTMLGGPGGQGKGTVFSVTGGSISVIATFSGENGEAPLPGVAVSGGVIYGTTQFGGANSAGVVYSVPVSARGVAPTILASLAGSGGNTNTSNGGLAVADGYIYGTDLIDGASPMNGSIFREPINGGEPSFSSFSGANGSRPGSNLVDVNGTLVGVTGEGGSAGEGQVFTFRSNTFGFTNAGVSFHGANSTNSGGAPFGFLTADALGNVYGVSLGENGSSTILWKLTGLGASDALSFASAPGTGIPGEPLNPIVVNAPAGDTVSLTISSSAAGLSGKTSAVADSNGHATFPGLVIAMAGTYSFTATDSDGLTPANSGLITVHDTATNFTWTGKAGDRNWSDPANWAGRKAPKAGMTVSLTFPDDASNLVTNDNVPNLTVTHLLISPGYTIRGSGTLFMAGGIDLMENSGVLAASVRGSRSRPALSARTASAKTTTRFENAVIPLAADMPLHTAPGTVLDLAGQISGKGGLTIDGMGVVELLRENTYSGGTLLSGGDLEVFNDHGLGSGELILTGGTLGSGGNGKTRRLANRVSIQDQGQVTIAAGTKPGSTLEFTQVLQVQQTSALTVTSGSLKLSGGIVVAPPTPSVIFPSEPHVLAIAAPNAGTGVEINGYITGAVKFSGGTESRGFTLTNFGLEKGSSLDFGKGTKTKFTGTFRGAGTINESGLLDLTRLAGPNDPSDGFAGTLSVLGGGVLQINEDPGTRFMTLRLVDATVIDSSYADVNIPGVTDFTGTNTIRMRGATLNFDQPPSFSGVGDKLRVVGGTIGFKAGIRDLAPPLPVIGRATIRIPAVQADLISPLPGSQIKVQTF